MCPEEPWLTGHRACQVRDMLVAQELARLAAMEPYRDWPEMVSYENQSGLYDLYRRLRWIWNDWQPPKDLPDS